MTYSYLTDPRVHFPPQGRGNTETLRQPLVGCSLQSSR